MDALFLFTTCNLASLRHVQRTSTEALRFFDVGREVSDVLVLRRVLFGVLGGATNATEVFLERTVKATGAEVTNLVPVPLVPRAVGIMIEVVNVATIDHGSAISGGENGGGGDVVGCGVYGHSVIVDIVASRRARHPIAGARVARGRGYHRRVIIAVGVDVGSGRSLRRLLMARQPLLLLLAEHLVGKILYQGECLPPFVAHQAYGRLLDDAVQQHQVLVFESLLLGPDEVIPQIILELRALLSYVRKVDEES